MSARTPLGAIDGAIPNERILVAMKQSADGSVALELLQQHHGAGIGWFNQRSLTLDARQWRQLRELLGAPGAADSLDAAAEEPRTVVPFPGPRERTARRKAASSR